MPGKGKRGIRVAVPDIVMEVPPRKGPRPQLAETEAHFHEVIVDSAGMVLHYPDQRDYSPRPTPWENFCHRFMMCISWSALAWSNTPGA